MSNPGVQPELDKAILDQTKRFGLNKDLKYIVTELLTTENDYMVKMRGLTQEKINRAKEAFSKLKGMPELQKREKQENLQKLFDTMQKLLSAQQSLQESLQNEGPKEWASKLIALSKIYVEFVALTGEGPSFPPEVDMAIWDKLPKGSNKTTRDKNSTKSTKVNAQLSGPTKDPRGSKLSDIIAAPYQRATKYPLLATQLVAASIEGDTKNNFKQFQNAAFEVAGNLNEGKRQYETSQVIGNVSELIQKYNKHPSHVNLNSIISLLSKNIEKLSAENVARLLASADFSKATSKDKKFIQDIIGLLKDPSDVLKSNIQSKEQELQKAKDELANALSDPLMASNSEKIDKLIKAEKIAEADITKLKNDLRSIQALSSTLEGKVESDKSHNQVTKGINKLLSRTEKSTLLYNNLKALSDKLNEDRVQVKPTGFASVLTKEISKLDRIQARILFNNVTLSKELGGLLPPGYVNPMEITPITSQQDRPSTLNTLPENQAPKQPEVQSPTLASISQPEVIRDISVVKELVGKAFEKHLAVNYKEFHDTKYNPALFEQYFNQLVGNFSEQSKIKLCKLTVDKIETLGNNMARSMGSMAAHFPNTEQLVGVSLYSLRTDLSNTLDFISQYQSAAYKSIKKPPTGDFAKDCGVAIIANIGSKRINYDLNAGDIGFGLIQAVNARLASKDVLSPDEAEKYFKVLVNVISGMMDEFGKQGKPYVTKMADKQALNKVIAKAIVEAASNLADKPNLQSLDPKALKKYGVDIVKQLQHKQLKETYKAGFSLEVQTAKHMSEIEVITGKLMDANRVLEKKVFPNLSTEHVPPQSQSIKTPSQTVPPPLPQRPAPSPPASPLSSASTTSPPGVTSAPPPPPKITTEMEKELKALQDKPPPPPPKTVTSSPVSSPTSSAKRSSATREEKLGAHRKRVKKSSKRSNRSNTRDDGVIVIGGGMRHKVASQRARNSGLQPEDLAKLQEIFERSNASDFVRINISLKAATIGNDKRDVKIQSYDDGTYKAIFTYPGRPLIKDENPKEVNFTQRDADIIFRNASSQVQPKPEAAPEKRKSVVFSQIHRGSEEAPTKGPASKVEETEKKRPRIGSRGKPD